MAAKPLLKLGVRKTIGSGLNTKVWSDHWIPDIPVRPARSASSLAIKDPQLLVHSLINPDTRSWDTNTLRRLFHEEEIPRILSLRPRNTRATDSFTWSYTTSGTYSVKSGYELACEEKTKSEMEIIREPNITPLLAQVWKTKTSRKLKHFMWNIQSGSISTCQRLKARHLGRDPTCPRCGMQEETINHLIFECPPALQVWALSDFPSPPGFFPSTSLYRNMDHLMWRTTNVGLTEEQQRIYPWIIWFIWKARNDKVFKANEISPRDTLILAITEAESWRRANMENPEEEPPDPPSPRRIRRNLPITICRIDASWTDQDPTSGFGWSIQGSDGITLSGMRGCRRCISPLHAELESLIWAMECTMRRDISAITFETDCSNLIKMTESPQDWPTFRTELDYYLDVKTFFESFSLTFIPRKYNTHADSLAKPARAYNYIFSIVS